MAILEKGQLDNFFHHRKELVELFLMVNEYLETLGSFKIKMTKGQICFSRDRQFTWIWLPPFKVKNRPTQYIVVSFGLDKRITDPKIVSSVEPYSGRWMHHVIVSTSDDMDDKFFRWLKMAFNYGLKKSANKH